MTRPRSNRTRVAGDCAASAKPWVLAVTILASSIAYIDEFVVNVALPAIETDLKTSAEVIQWLVNAYTLCLSAFLLTGGAAGDLFGRRRIFVMGIAIFAVMSIWCGLSPDVFQLLLGARHSGGGGGAADPVLAGDHWCDLRRSRAGQGDRHLGRLFRACWRRRSAAWRLDRRSFQLALDFSHQSRCWRCRQSGSLSTKCRRAATRRPKVDSIGAARCSPSCRSAALRLV